MICKKCGHEILNIADYYNRLTCWPCRKKYLDEYKKKNIDRIKENYKTRQWLKGADDDWLLGDDLDIDLISINGKLKVKIK